MPNTPKFLLLAWLFLIISGCNDTNSTENTEATAVPVIEVTGRTVTAYNSFPATIEGTINSAVRAKVPGYITQVLVDEGQQVKKGQTLFTLETETLSSDAEAARAEVNAAQVEVDKLKPLVEKDIISPVQLQTAEARLAQAKSRYNSIAANINYATIKSPVDGNVGAINFRSGALVSPGDPLPLTIVSQTEEVYAFFAMNENDYFGFLEKTPGSSLSEKIDNFPKIKLMLAGNREYSHEGEIKTVNAQVNRQTGTVNFRATFPNPEGILTNGNSGTVRIPQVYENATVIPSKSTYEAQGYTYAFKLTKGDTARRVLVEVEENVDGLYIINKGLNKGDTIVAEGVARVDNNSRITPKPTSFDSIARTTKTFFN
jgi:membrane fusion protein, multidrug efflux system